MKENLERIIDYYGVNNQLKKLNEECFELIDSIRDYEYLYEDHWTELIDERDEEYKKHIEEEYADVMVMLEQFKNYYNLNNSNITKIMHEKIDRQICRIEKQEVNNDN